MTETATAQIPSYLATLEQLIADVVAPAAAEIDQAGTFPRAALDALGAAGLLGLISAPEVGGQGQAHRAAALVVERLAQECASTAMVVCMHYAGTAVIEAHGPRDVRQAIAEGRHLTTLAFSEAGSRSHFWAPISTAVASNGHVQLDAQKSWATAAGQADSYVWSSRPLAAEGPSTIWLVPGNADGLRIPAPFNGLGLRGNHSSPVTAAGVDVPKTAMLGPDGGGFDVMMGIVLPYFQLMNAAASVGTMEVATTKAAAADGAGGAHAVAGRPRRRVSAARSRGRCHRLLRSRRRDCRRRLSVLKHTTSPSSILDRSMVSWYHASCLPWSYSCQRKRRSAHVLERYAA